MKCCAFGTVRMDIHAYQEIDNLDEHEEIKINEMNMAIGGSVYNTVSVLNDLKQDIVFYMLNSVDDFADFIKIKMNKRNINYITCKQDKNDTATSLIFVDMQGKKKMISYDGVRQDKYILSKLMKDIEQYELFYTSFYEINQDNYHDIINIMSLCQINFVDLSPLIYKVDDYVINDILQQVQILSGTEEEYDILLGKTNCDSFEDLVAKNNISYLFVKKGSRGAMVITQKNMYEYAPSEKKNSHDTTGCGDTFNAGIIDSLTKKVNDEWMLQEAVEMATKVAYEGFKEGMFSN